MPTLLELLDGLDFTASQEPQAQLEDYMNYHEDEQGALNLHGQSGAPVTKVALKGEKTMNLLDLYLTLFGNTGVFAKETPDGGYRIGKPFVGGGANVTYKW